MARESFNYDRSVRYLDRTIRKIVDALKVSLTKPSTSKTVAEVRINLNELIAEYDKFKTYTDRGFNATDSTLCAEEIAKRENTMINNFDVMKKLVTPLLAEDNDYSQ